MQRLAGLILSLSAVTGSAFAGQIQIGGVNGLTSSYVNNGVGSAGTFVEANYDSRLFVNATPAPTPYSTYSTTAARTGSITGTGTYDTGVMFNMINDGLTAAVSNNFWQAQSGATTITVPVGIADVTDVWTMLNNEWGLQGNATETSVTFNFGTTANQASGYTTVTVALQNAGNANAAASGQIGTAISCANTANCLLYAGGALAPTSTLANTGTSAGTLANVTVNTDSAELLDSPYTGLTVGVFKSSTGNLTLDDQNFIFGSAFSNLYLVSISVTDSVGAGPTSETALSAITVDQAPEPSTILLFLAGFGALGVSRLRRS